MSPLSQAVAYAALLPAGGRCIAGPVSSEAVSGESEADDVLEIIWNIKEKKKIVT